MNYSLQTTLEQSCTSNKQPHMGMLFNNVHLNDDTRQQILPNNKINSSTILLKRFHFNGHAWGFYQCNPVENTANQNSGKPLYTVEG